MLHKLCHAINRVIFTEYDIVNRFYRNIIVDREVNKSISVIAPLSRISYCDRNKIPSGSGRISFLAFARRAKCNRVAQVLPAPLEIPDKPESSRDAHAASAFRNGCTRLPSIRTLHVHTHACTERRAGALVQFPRCRSQLRLAAIRTYMA